MIALTESSGRAPVAWFPSAVPWGTGRKSKAHHDFTNGGTRKWGRKKMQGEMPGVDVWGVCGCLASTHAIGKRSVEKVIIASSDNGERLRQAICFSIW